MKKNLLLILLALSVSSGFAQINGDYNYSVAVKGFSLMQMPKILSQKNADRFTSMWFKGAMVKFNDNQFSYRIGGNYLRKDLRLVNDCVGCQEADGEMKDYSFKLGFEKNLSFSRFQPYLGFDLGYRVNKFDGFLETTNPAVADKALFGPDLVEATKTGVTLSPVFGFKINPVPMVSLFAESNLDFFIFYEKQEMVKQDVNNTKTVNSYNKTEFLLNPITVGLQIHLGNNR